MEINEYRGRVSELPKQNDESHLKGSFSRRKNLRSSHERDPFRGPPPLPSPEKIQKYRRTDRIDTAGIITKDRNRYFSRLGKKFHKSQEKAAKSELLLSEQPGFLEADEDEETFEFSQHEIAKAVDITSATKFFDLKLHQFGPYKFNFTRNGRNLLLGGERGHVAAFDWVTKKLHFEMNVMESVHAVSWLHMPTMLAIAQKKWVHIYDNQGIELHCVKRLDRIQSMEFLPYHFLLATGSDSGFLSWLDVSIGQLVCTLPAKCGPLNIMTQNPHNAVLLSGHPNGTVKMWSPNAKEPLVSMLCHTQSVKAIAVDNRGLYLATAGIDRSLKIWDIRTYKCLRSYKLGGSAGHICFSQRNLLAVSLGKIVEVYKNCVTEEIDSPYLIHRVETTISDLHFCPYEDVLGLSHRRGYTSILTPGSGEPNFDAFESNPYMTKEQRKEMEIKALLEKIQPDMISLNPKKLGEVDVKTLKTKLDSKKKFLYVKPPEITFEPRNRMKGKSSGGKKLKRKKGVIEEKKKNFIRSAIKLQKKPVEEKAKGALGRFKASL